MRTHVCEPEPVSSIFRHEWHCCLPSISYCWPSFSSTVSHHFSLLQSVTLLCLFTWCQPLYASCCTVCTTVLFKVLYFTFKMFNFCVCFFMYYLCEKYYKSITLQYYVANCVSWAPRLTSFDLQMRSWIETCSLIADLLYCSLFNSWVGKIPWRRDRLPTPVLLGFPGGSDGKESACIVRDLDSIPRLGRSPGKGNLNIHWKNWCWSSSILVIWWEQMTLEKSLMLGKIEGRKRRGHQRMRWLECITDAMSMNMGKLREMLRDREAGSAAIHGVTKSPTWLGN